MDLKFLSILLFVVCHAFASNKTATTGTGSSDTEEKVKIYAAQVFNGLPGEMIAQYSSEAILKTMSLAGIKSANFELNRRFKILHYQNGKISPPYLAKAYNHLCRQGYLSPRYRENFQKFHWTPYQAILFGNENPIDITPWLYYRRLVMISSRNDHLKIFHTSSPIMNLAFMQEEMQEKGNPMNGVIFPRGLHFESFKVIPIGSVLSSQAEYNLAIHENDKKPLKLAIVINSAEKDETPTDDNRALKATRVIRNDFIDTPICVVSQPDIRKDSDQRFERKDGLVLLFHGSHINVSTLVVDKNNTDEMLETKFEKWKKDLFFLDSHQITAFHLTALGGNEPEKREKIFSEVFPDIPLSTLRLLDESSTIGVNEQIGKSSRFQEGVVFVIIGFEKFG